MPDRPYRIVYVGRLAYGETCLQRMEALQDLGHLVVGIDTISPEIQRRATMPMERLRRKFWGPRDLGQINEQVIQMVETHSPDILWIDKGLIIDPDTLLRVKKILPRIVRLSYSPDDMLNPDKIGRAHV